MDTTQTYDLIIWGASLEAIHTAIQAQSQGQRVLLINKFGFPGGALTEALALPFDTAQAHEQLLVGMLVQEAQAYPRGLLYQNGSILLHPESIKRSLWNLLEREELPLLFHVVPTALRQVGTVQLLQLFGREGHIELQARRVLDLSDDRYLTRACGLSTAQPVAWQMGCFLTPGASLHAQFPEAQWTETPIGSYLQLRRSLPADADVATLFNQQLDHIGQLAWGTAQRRLLIIPARPALIFD